MLYPGHSPGEEIKDRRVKSKESAGVWTHLRRLGSCPGVPSEGWEWCWAGQR